MCARLSENVGHSPRYRKLLLFMLYAHTHLLFMLYTHTHLLFMLYTHTHLSFMLYTYTLLLFMIYTYMTLAFFVFPDCPPGTNQIIAAAAAGVAGKF